MRKYIIVVSALLIATSGCAALQADNGTSGTEIPSTNTTTETNQTPCKSDLMMDLVQNPDVNRSDPGVYNYSDLSDRKKELFDEAQYGSAKIIKDVFWAQVSFIWYDGGYYEPKIAYC